MTLMKLMTLIKSNIASEAMYTLKLIKLSIAHETVLKVLTMLMKLIKLMRLMKLMKSCLVN